MTDKRAMDKGIKDLKEPKRVPTEKACSLLHKIFIVLSVVAILLIIGLFVRLETVVREMKMMDSKLSQEIQQVKDALKEKAKPQTSANETVDAAIGRLLRRLRVEIVEL